MGPAPQRHTALVPPAVDCVRRWPRPDLDLRQVRGQSPAPTPPDPALGAAVRQLREARGLSQEALAYRAGTTYGTINRLELAQSAPAWATVRAIADALGIKLVELAAAVEAQGRPRR